MKYYMTYQPMWYNISANGAKVPGADLPYGMDFSNCIILFIIASKAKMVVANDDKIY
jgi:hypothetical protein